MVPPKDPYIQIRVLEDNGKVSLGDHSVSLTKNSLHFLRRMDAAQFISQVCIPSVSTPVIIITSSNNVLLNI
jgi:hypothetical protein